MGLSQFLCCVTVEGARYSAPQADRATKLCLEDVQDMGASKIWAPV